MTVDTTLNMPSVSEYLIFGLFVKPKNEDKFLFASHLNIIEEYVFFKGPSISGNDETLLLTKKNIFVSSDLLIFSIIFQFSKPYTEKLIKSGEIKKNNNFKIISHMKLKFMYILILYLKLL